MKEIKRRLGMATNKLKATKNLWKRGNERTKLKLLRALIFPIATYGSETWSLSKEAEKKITAFEMKSYRRILKIQWIEKRTNKSILEQLGNIPENWLLNTTARQKLTFLDTLRGTSA